MEEIPLAPIWANRPPIDPLRARLMPPTWHGDDGFRLKVWGLRIVATAVACVALRFAVHYVPGWINNPDSFLDLATIWPISVMTSTSIVAILLHLETSDAAADGLDRFWINAREMHREHPIGQKHWGWNIAAVALALISLGFAAEYVPGWINNPGSFWSLGTVWPVSVMTSTTLGAILLRLEVQHPIGWKQRFFCAPKQEDSAEQILSQIRTLHFKTRLPAKDKLLENRATVTHSPQLLRYYRAAIHFLNEASKRVNDARGQVTYRLAQIYYLYFHNILAEGSPLGQVPLETLLRKDEVQRYICYGGENFEVNGEGCMPLAWVNSKLIN
ncbi:MAG: hypothetical protein JSR80_07280 [Verrucomicrobia bacterium]|nr:hypothetical protein [Verrucomicrobiota bacterium]